MGSSCECMVISNHYSKQTIFLENKAHLSERQIHIKNTNSNMNTLSCIKKNTSSSFIYESKNFENLLLKEINHVRHCPMSYAVKLKNFLNYVQTENNVCILTYAKEKIVLNKGIQMFLEAILYLNKMTPLNELKLNEEVRINVGNMEFEKEMECIEMLKRILVNKKGEILKKYSKCLFTYDIFRNPELSVVFQITDEAFGGRRREVILSPNVSYFATCCFYNKDKQFTSISSFV